MSQLRALAGQTALYGLSTIVGRMLNYLLVPLYTRLFLPAEYGVVTDLYALVAFLNVVFSYGMETAFFRKSAEKPTATYATAFWSLVISSLVFTALLWLFAAPIAQSLQYPDKVAYVQWFALILGLDALAVIPFARLRQQNKALRFALIKLFNIGLNIGLNLFFLLALPQIVASDTAWAQWLAFLPTDLGVGYIFLANLIANALTLLWLLPGTPTFRGFDKSLWRELFVYGLPLLPAGLAGMVNETLDRVLLKYLLPGNTQENLHQLGIYGAVYKIAMLMSLFTQTFRTAAEPFFFQQAKNGQAQATYALVMRYFVLTAALLMAAILLFMQLIKYFIGEAYHEGLAVVPVLLLANLLLGIYYNQSIWYKLADKTRFGMWFSLAGALITVAANFLLIPLLGYMGAALATLLCYASMVAMSHYFGQRMYPVAYPWKSMGLYVGIAIILGVLEARILVDLPDTAAWTLRITAWLGFVAFAFWREKPFKSLT
jgi:O-antigen/teichoic acid export membrane protein